MVGMNQSSTKWGGNNAGGKAKATPGKHQENDQTNGKTVGTPKVGSK